MSQAHGFNKNFSRPQKSTEDIPFYEDEMSVIDQHKLTFAMAWLEGHNIKECAEIAGVSTTTGYAWQDDPTIQDLIRKAQQKIQDKYINELMRQGKTAVKVLVDAMENKEVTQNQRAAAESVLDRIGVSKQEIIRRINDNSGGTRVIREKKSLLPENARQTQEKRRLLNAGSPIEAKFKEHELEEFEKER